MSAPTWIARALVLRASNPVALALLVVANVVPLLGVLFLGWDVRTILIMYWLENGIVGVLNVVRILKAQRPDANGPATPAAKIGFAAFFTVHYGIFWAGHGVFVMLITAPGGFTGSGRLESPLAAALSDSGILLGATALLASHLASLVLNYLGKGEYKRVSPSSQMFAPYARVFVLHLTIVLGAFVIIEVDQPVYLVALLVGFKTLADLGFHLFERSRYGRATALV